MTDYVISDNWLLELVSMHVSDARKREIRDTVFNKYPLSDVREHLMRDVIEELERIRETKRDDPGSVYAAYEKAISLIRDGVKK